MSYRKAPGIRTINHQIAGFDFPGLDAFVDRLTGKSKYFSFPFNSLILMVIGEWTHRFSSREESP